MSHSKTALSDIFFLSVSVGAFQRLFLEAIYDLPLRGPHGSKAGVVMIHSGLFCLGVASSTCRPTPSSESGLCTLGWTQRLYLYRGSPHLMISQFVIPTISWFCFRPKFCEFISISWFWIKKIKIKSEKIFGFFKKFLFIVFCLYSMVLNRSLCAFILFREASPNQTRLKVLRS